MCVGAVGEQDTFGVNQVIQGWTEGGQLMNVGSENVFVVPHELGDGDSGDCGVIVFNETATTEIYTSLFVGSVGCV